MQNAFLISIIERKIVNVSLTFVETPHIIKLPIKLQNEDAYEKNNFCTDVCAFLYDGSGL